MLNIKKEFMDYYLVFLLASMMASVNTCEFGNDAIQGVYDRGEVFRKTKDFDTTNRTVPLDQTYRYSYDEYSDGSKQLRMNINGEDIWESYETNSGNKIKTIVGSYNFYQGGKQISGLHFQRNDNGEIKFEDLLNHDVKTLPSLNAALPNNVDENFKQVFLDLQTMRQKMFDFQKGLSKDDFKRVKAFDHTIFSNGKFSFTYTENDVGTLSIWPAKVDGTITGQMTCDKKEQKFNILDGKIAVDGEPLLPV